ncbi:MAG: DUF177 domain-containing protein [Lachnospiraceae bacterium]|nr:DUF177 domain-containing protein [Lachnospiraceae bacterium]
MLINLSDVFKEREKVLKETVAVELEDFQSMGTKYPLCEKSDVRWTFTNIEPGRVKVEGNAKLVFTAPCDRCLKDVKVELMLTPERYVVPPETLDPEDEEVDDLSFMEGYNLNTETLLYNEIMENWPAKILCREDCKGLCLVCGRNLNEGECGCDRFVPDPRLAGIQDLFKACKEV